MEGSRGRRTYVAVACLCASQFWAVGTLVALRFCVELATLYAPGVMNIRLPASGRWLAPLPVPLAALWVLSRVCVWGFWARWGRTLTRTVTPLHAFTFGCSAWLIAVAMGCEPGVGPAAKAALWCLVAFALPIPILRTRFIHARAAPLGDDMPIESARDDALGRTEQRDRLARFLTDCRERGRTVIGLWGGWGEGKTSFLNLLEEGFRDDKDMVLVRFDPWQFHRGDHPAKLVLEEVQAAVNRRFLAYDFRRAARRYSRLLGGALPVAGVEWGQLSDLVMPGDDRLGPAQRRLERILDELGCSVLLMVDDLDRLEPGRLMRLLPTLCIATRMARVVTIVAADETELARTIAQAMSRDTPEDGSDYLHKLVQFSVRLHLPTPAMVQAELRAAVEDALPAAWGAQARTHAQWLAEECRAHLDQVIRTLRDVKLYVNSLRQHDLEFARRELNPGNFLLLQVLRVFWSRVYEDVWQNAWAYLRAEDADAERAEADEVVARALTGARGPRAVRHVLHSLFPALKTGPGAPSPGVDDDEAWQRRLISHPARFPKYFEVKVREGQVPTDAVLGVLELIRGVDDRGAAEGLRVRLLQWHNAGLGDRFLLDLSRSLRGESPDTLRRLCRALTQCSAAYSWAPPEEGRLSEGVAATHTLLTSLDCVESGGDQGARDRFVQSLVREGGTPDFAAAVLSRALPEGEEDGQGGLCELRGPLIERFRSETEAESWDPFGSAQDPHVVFGPWCAWAGAGWERDRDALLMPLVREEPRRLVGLIQGYMLRATLGDPVASPPFERGLFEEMWDSEPFVELACEHGWELCETDAERNALRAFAEAYEIDLPASSPRAAGPAPSPDPQHPS